MSYEPDEPEIINTLSRTDMSLSSRNPAIITLAKKKGQLSKEIILIKTIYNNQVMAVCKRNRSDENKIDLYLKYFDFDGTVNENPKKKSVITIDISPEKNVSNDLLAFLSQDRSKLLVVQTIYTFQKKTYSWETVGRIFDIADSKKISEFSIPRFQNNLELTTKEMLITNNGDVFCPSTIPKSISLDLPTITDRNLDKIPMAPVVFCLKSNEKTFNGIKLYETLSSYQDYKLKEISKTVYAYGSFFSKVNNTSEIFYATLDASSAKINSFNSVRLSSTITNKLKEIPKAYITSNKLFIKDGYVFVMCQNTYLDEYSGYDGRTFYRLLDRDIILGKFNTGNSTTQIHLIPKNAGFALKNYHMYLNNGTLHLIYAEHPKNLEEYTLETYKMAEYNMIINYNGSVTVCTKISADGTMKRETLFENKGWCFKPENLDIVIENENALILHMIKGKKERFDKLIIK